MQISDEMVKVAAIALVKREYGRYADLNTIPQKASERILEDAKAALSAALALSGWRTIDSAPKDGTRIVAYNVSHDEQVVVGWCANPGLPEIYPDGCWTDTGIRNRAINYCVNEHYFQHWKPLDAPHATAGKEG